MPSGPPIDCAAGEPVPQSLFGGTTEIDLADGAVLRFASHPGPPGGTIALQQRTARIGAGATLRFAIAQLGGRVVRSRIDNRLEGDGSEVEQVEIVFGGRDQLFDLTAYTRHVGRDTTGNLLLEGRPAARRRGPTSRASSPSRRRPAAPTASWASSG